MKNDKPTRELGLIKDVCRVLLRIYGESAAEDFGPTKLKAVRQVMVDEGLDLYRVKRAGNPGTLLITLNGKPLFLSKRGRHTGAGSSRC